MTYYKKYRVGELRPSQLLYTYGVGAIIDLPHLSTMVMGLEDWNTRNAEEIEEPRLLQAIQSLIGPQFKRLLAPPVEPNSADIYSKIGVPVSTFPRWMVCTACRMLASIDDGFFTLQPNPYHPDKICYRHPTCSSGKGKKPLVVPARFLIACKAGHMDDFPWHHFVHGDRPCKAELYMYERGVSGEPSDIYIKCETCQQGRAMSDAFSSYEDDRTYRPSCSRFKPHLRTTQQKACPYKEAKTILRSASNTWFPLVYSSLSIPEGQNPLDERIETHWPTLQVVVDRKMLESFLAIPGIKADLSRYSLEEIWERVTQKQNEDTVTVKPNDLKTPEWLVLSDPLNAPRTDDFVVVPLENVPEGYEDFIQQVILVEKLREVQALTGFTRIESLGDYTEEEELPQDHIMKLARKPPQWLPATEVRGEGIFIQFREEAIQKWLHQLAVQKHNETFLHAHKRWRKARHLEPEEANYPEMRYVLLHTFSHALMRQLTLECGYAAASIRERIYAQPPEAPGGPMAGILLYTAASDSEGTLGGLVSLGRRLGFHIDGALDDIQYCASDPLCAEHVSLEDNTLHGSACHACMFAPETSCERGNRYLDRSVLIRTVERDNLAFFPKKVT